MIIKTVMHAEVIHFCLINMKYKFVQMIYRGIKWNSPLLMNQAKRAIGSTMHIGNTPTQHAQPNTQPVGAK